MTLNVHDCGRLGASIRETVRPPQQEAPVRLLLMGVTNPRGLTDICCNYERL